MPAEAQIGLALVVAVFGAFLSHLVQVVFRCRRFRKLHVLYGPWISAYQTLDAPERAWVSEAVQIDLYHGQLRIRNSDNARGYSYVSVSDLVADSYLHGDYQSQQGQQAERGVAILYISGARDLIYGYWSGPNATESTQYVGWVLGKQEADVERARQALASASQTFPLAPAA